MLVGTAAQAGGFYYYPGPDYPIVGGTYYTPVPYGAYYAPRVRYVTPVTYTYGPVPVTAVTQVQTVEPVPTVAGTATAVTTQTQTTTQTVAPVPVTTTYSYGPVYAAPVYVEPVRFVPPSRVHVGPRRAVVRYRY